MINRCIGDFDYFSQHILILPEQFPLISWQSEYYLNTTRNSGLEASKYEKWVFAAVKLD